MEPLVVAVVVGEAVVGDIDSGCWSATRRHTYSRQSGCDTMQRNAMDICAPVLFINIVSGGNLAPLLGHMHIGCA